MIGCIHAATFLPSPPPSHSSFRQDGSIFDPALYDIYLSYCQRTTSHQSIHKAPSSSSLPHVAAYEEPTALQFHVLPVAPSLTPLLHPNPPAVVTLPLSSSISSSSSSATSLPMTVFAEKRSQTIYDAELRLLLDCSPKTPEQVPKLLSEFAPFQHGSFLLYSQRGLLETYPLDYICCSVSGNATVQEAHKVQAAPPSDGDPGSSAAVPGPSQSSGYQFPTSRVTDLGRAGRHLSGGPAPSQPLPPELTDSRILPKELVMHIDFLKSGQAYSAVLKFHQVVLLTDVSISVNPLVSSVSVDVWEGRGGGEEEAREEEELVRIAQCTEIQEKSLMLGNLMPRPRCRYVKERGVCVCVCVCVCV